MKGKQGKGRLARSVAGVVLVAYTSACTHMPSGEKAFDSFESCFAANMGLAALGGIGVGYLTKQVTNKDSAAVAAGVAATALIAITAWRKCSAAYAKSERVDKPAGQQPVQAPPRRQPGVSLDRLDVRVEGTENDPPIPEFDLTYADKDPAAKDIKARFRHKVEIVRFTSDSDDKLVLADAKGNAMVGPNGKPIPLEEASRMPRDKLTWMPIAEDGRDDYVEDVVIQQAQRVSYRHKIPVPPRAQLPLPLPAPMRYTLTVEVGDQKTTRTVDFALLDKPMRPKRFTSGGEQQGGGVATRSLSAPAAAASTSAGGSAYTSRRKVALVDSAGGKAVVGSLAARERVTVDASEDVPQGAKSVKWVHVKSDKGNVGWVKESDLQAAK